MLVLKGLVGLHRTSQLQLFSVTGRGIDLDNHDIADIVCCGNEQRSLCCFWECIQVLHLDSFVDCDDYSISCKGFLPTEGDIMVFWVKFTHSSPFWFADSYNVNVHSCHLLFDTSNLPLFMDLTFLVPMQCCFLQHQTFLPSPITSTTGCCFCFSSIPSFFLKKKCRKAKWLSEDVLQIAVKRREVKSKGENERYKHLNAELQRIGRRDKKKSLPQWSLQRNRGKQENGKD